MSLTVFGGSLEFVAVSMLLAPFAPVQVMAITCMVQARHLFYGIAMLDRYRGMGWKKAYLIFGLCDETFSINYSARIPEGVDRGWFYFFVTLLNHFYRVSGATIGGVAGSLVVFDTSGLEFVMTAMFVVIFLEQWLKERRHWTALIGVGAAAGCRLVFGADSFVVPTMVCILVLLMACAGRSRSREVCCESCPAGLDRRYLRSRHCCHALSAVPRVRPRAADAGVRPLPRPGVARSGLRHAGGLQSQGRLPRLGRSRGP